MKKIKYDLLSNQIDGTSALENGEKFFIVEQLDCTSDIKTNYIITQESLEYFLKTGIIDHKKRFFYLVKKQAIEQMKKYGFNNAVVQDLKRHSPHLFVNNITSSNIFKDILKNEYVVIQKISHVNGGHVWMTPDLIKHCEPFIIDGNPKSQLHDGAYHLRGLFEHLLMCSDVAFFTNTARFDEKVSQLLQTPFSLSDSSLSLSDIICEMTVHCEEGEAPLVEKNEITLLYYPQSDNVDFLISWSDAIARQPQNQSNEIYFVERYILKNILNADKYLLQKKNRKFVI